LEESSRLSAESSLGIVEPATESRSVVSEDLSRSELGELAVGGIVDESDGDSERIASLFSGPVPYRAARCAASGGLFTPGTRQ
jgi:hypothetical protein